MAEESGDVQVAYRNPQGDQVPVMSFRTGQASQGTIAPVGVNRESLPTNFDLGARDISAREDTEVVILFKSDSADTIESEESNLELVGQLVDNRTGVSIGKTLTFDNTVGFTGTTDIVASTVALLDVATFTVPKGQSFRLVQSAKMHIFLGDDT